MSTSEFAKDSLSLEETNKLRISLGLKPLSDDSAPTSKQGGGETSSSSPPPPQDKDAIAEENYRNRREQEAKSRQEEEIRQRIAKAQNKRDLQRRLRGPTLGDADPSSSTSTSTPEDSKSTLKWLKQTQKKAKENAARRAKELEEQEAAALEASTSALYGDSDLAGLKVGHDIEDFDLRDGDEQGRILTLRDAKILDGDEDELMDASLEQREIDRRNKERKKGPKQYTGLEEDDDMDQDGGSYGRKRGVLSKYDADIKDGSIRANEDGGGGFRLGGSVETPEERRENKRREAEEEARRKNRTLLSLDYTKNQEVSDYMQPGDVGFKKSKTKKKKQRPQATRIKLDDDDEGGGGGATQPDVDMENGTVPAPHARRQAEDRDNLIDDDELAASLAKARRAKAKRAASKVTPEDIARNLKAQKEAEEREEAERQQAAREQQQQAAPTPQTDLTFDATSEFIRNIAQRPSSPEASSSSRRQPTAAVKTEQASPAAPPPSTVIKTEPQDDDGDGAPLIADQPMGEAVADDDEMDDEEEARRALAALEASRTPSLSPDRDLVGTSAEPSVSSGISGTLRLLQAQGLLEGTTPEQRQREAAQKSYDAWKARHMAEEAVKEQERQMSKMQGSAKDQATREYENKLRELEDARRAEARFKDYKPDVDIKYHDQYGRVLNNHEAWKLLSHTFHGKMPGRAKQEKYRKKVEEERKRERMAAGESHDMSKAFRERQIREGQAHMVLSVGAKGNAPQDFAQHALGPNLVNKRVVESGGGGGGDVKGKGKGGRGKATPAVAGSPSVSTPQSFVTATALSPPLPQIISNGGGSGDTTAHRGWSSVASPAAPTPPPQQQQTTNGDGTAAAAPPPRMKPAFAPIGGGGAAPTSGSSSPATVAAAAAAAKPNGASAASGGGFKLAFGSGSGAGTKRKAEEQGRRQ